MWYGVHGDDVVVCVVITRYVVVRVQVAVGFVVCPMVWAGDKVVLGCKT